MDMSIVNRAPDSVNPIQSFLSAFHFNKDGMIQVNVGTFKEEYAQFFAGIPRFPEETQAHDIWFSPALRKRKGTEKDDVLGTVALWVDVDGEFEGSSLPPSIIVRSGHGWHLYWLLDEPITDLDLVEQLNKIMIKDVPNSDSGCWNCNRILRVPYTTNNKFKDAPVPVELKHHSNIRYSVADIRAIAKLSDQTRLQIRTGALNKNKASGKNTRSERDFAVIMDLVRGGASDELIKNIFEHQPIGDKYRQKDTPNGYLQRTIKKARDEAANSVELVDTHSTGAKFQLTDLGNAERLATQHGDDVRYCKQWKKWIIWNGKHWEIDETDAIIRKAKITIRSMYDEAKNVDDDEYRQKLARHAAKSESEGRINAMVNLARAEPGISVKPEVFDRDPYLLNVLNGVIDLHTGELIPHRRNDYITHMVPVAYDPQAEAPLWMQFLAKVTNGNAELVTYLQHVVGYTLTGDVAEQCLFFLHGKGKNGKTTFMEVIMKLLGGYAQKSPSEMLQVKNTNSIPHDIARLRGARLAVTSETEEGKRWDEAKVKDLAGGDRLVARFMFGDYFEFDPTHKLFVYGNHKAIIRGTDEGIWRRMRLIPFTVHIPPEERDLHFKEKLLAELPGILNWSVAGCLAWQQQGLHEPSTVRDATKQYREDMDVINQFIDDECVCDPAQRVAASDLYQAYSTWCKENGEYVSTNKVFGMRMSEHGIERRRLGAGKFYVGIGLRITEVTLEDA